MKEPLAIIVVALFFLPFYILLDRPAPGLRQEYRANWPSNYRNLIEPTPTPRPRLRFIVEPTPMPTTTRKDIRT